VSYRKNILTMCFCLVSVLLPVIAGAVTCDPNLEGKSEQELLAIEAQCNVEIADLDTKINGTNGTKQFSSELTKGITDLKNKIAKMQLEIKAKNAKIKQLGENIVVKRFVLYEF